MTTYFPIAYTAVQYIDKITNQPYSGAVLKAYAASTSTPINLATDYTGNTLVGSIALNDAGYPEVSGNIVIPHASEDIKLALYPTQTAADSNTGEIWQIDNISITSAAAADTFSQTFSGDNTTTEFSLSTDLGDDEQSILVYVSEGLGEYHTNGGFDTDTNWTKGADWTIGSGVATASTSDEAISQDAASTIVEGESYNITYTITRSAGSIVPSIGGTDGESRSATGTYKETIIAGSTQVIAFTGTGFTGTVDDVSVTNVTTKPPRVMFPSEFTLANSTLTFDTAPVKGTDNILVLAPTLFVGAAASFASAASISATAAAASATAAATSATNAATSETNAGTSETNAANSATSAASSATAAASSASSIGDEVSYAEEWASKAEDSAVSVAAGGDGSTTFSALHWAAKAADSAASITLPALGSARQVLKINGAGTGLEYGFLNALNISDGAITTNKHGNDSVTLAKMEHGTQGDILYYGASGEPLRLAAGTSGQVLKTQGAGANPQWGDATGGWTDIETIDLSDQATADFETDVSSYNVVEFEFIDVVPATNDSALHMRTSSDGGSTYDSGASHYAWSFEGNEAPTNNLATGDSADTQIVLTAGATVTEGVGNDTGESLNGTITLYNPSGTKFTQVEYSFVYITASGLPARIHGTGARLSAADVDGIRFLFDGSSNLLSGKIIQRAR